MISCTNIKNDFFITITTFAYRNVKLAKELTVRTKVSFLHILEKVFISSIIRGCGGMRSGCKQYLFSLQLFFIAYGKSFPL